MKVTHRVRITPSEIEVDGQRAGTTATGAEMLAAVYRQRIGGYPKFFKMDTLSRLGGGGKRAICGARRPGCGDGQPQFVAEYRPPLPTDDLQ